MSETNKQFRKRLPMNALMGVLSFLTYSVSAIWLTPYLVGHMGPAAYGLVPLAGLFTQYVSLITAQISNSVNRFLTIEILKPEGRPNVIFNSSLALYLLLIVIQLPLFVVGIFYADRIFTIPPELKIDALLLLGCSAASFLVSLLSAVFGVSMFCRNRLDITYSLHLVRLMARIILIVVLFLIFGAKLRYIGYVDLSLNLFSLVINWFLWRKLTPELHVAPRDVDPKILKPIFKMSFWTLVTQLGAMLYLRTDIWIINKFISPVAAGQYAAILVAANFVRQLARLFSGQLTPTVMNYWAKEEFAYLRQMLSFTVKIMSFGLAIPVAFICFNGGDILTLWLGNDFSGMGTLLFILAIHLPINNAVYPLFNFLTASNSVKVPAIVTFIMGVCNLIFSYYLGVTLGMGAIGVAIATAIVLTLKNALFTPIYAAHILKLSHWVFLTPLYGSYLVIALVYALTFVPVVSWLRLNPAGFAGLTLQALFICFTCGIVGWVLVITKNEKRIIFSMIPAGIRNKIPGLS